MILSLIQVRLGIVRVKSAPQGQYEGTAPSWVKIPRQKKKEILKSGAVGGWWVLLKRLDSDIFCEFGVLHLNVELTLLGYYVIFLESFVHVVLNICWSQKVLNLSIFVFFNYFYLFQFWNKTTTRPYKGMKDFKL